MCRQTLNKTDTDTFNLYELWALNNHNKVCFVKLTSYNEQKMAKLKTLAFAGSLDYKDNLFIYIFNIYSTFPTRCECSFVSHHLRESILKSSFSMRLYTASSKASWETEEDSPIC